jgi:hypothetical protein
MTHNMEHSKVASALHTEEGIANAEPPSSQEDNMPHLAIVAPVDSCTAADCRMGRRGCDTVGCLQICRHLGWDAAGKGIGETVAVEGIEEHAAEEGSLPAEERTEVVATEEGTVVSNAEEGSLLIEVHTEELTAEEGSLSTEVHTEEPTVEEGSFTVEEDKQLDLDRIKLVSLRLAMKEKDINCLLVIH